MSTNNKIISIDTEHVADVEEHFGSRLRKERKKIGLTQASIAAIGGVKRTTQHIYESGARVPDVNYLKKIVEAGCNLNYLIYGDNLPDTETNLIKIDLKNITHIYEVIEEFCIDSNGNALPLESKVLIFQFLCAALKLKKEKNEIFEIIRRELIALRN